ncbi:hypothetical protein [Actinopolymorpha pittospori]
MELTQFFVERSKVVHNTAGDDGGAAINNFGEFVVEKSKLNENKAIGGIAGGFGNAGEAVLRNSEVNERRSPRSPRPAGSLAASRTSTKGRSG